MFLPVVFIYHVFHCAVGMVSPHGRITGIRSRTYFSMAAGLSRPFVWEGEDAREELAQSARGPPDTSPLLNSQSNEKFVKNHLYHWIYPRGKANGMVSVENHVVVINITKFSIFNILPQNPKSAPHPIPVYPVLCRKNET